MKNPRNLLLALACLGFVAPAFAAEEAAPTASEIATLAPAAPAAKLEVGSPAPVLKPAKWLQGEPVTAFEKDKTYIIECWATWCGPCVAAIPHVNALHNKFKDKGLVVIGVNVWEEPADKAEAFVKKKGDGMAYRVAYDGGQSGSVANNWLKAAGVNGIPHAFVVRENTILWHGHPAQLTDETVADMIAGKYDPAKVAAAAAENEKLGAEFGELYGKFQELTKAGKAAEAEKLLGRQIEIAQKIMPDKAPLVKEGGLIELALARKDPKDAVAHIRAFAAAGEKQNDPSSQWMAAAQTITDERLAGNRDYAFALARIDKLIEFAPPAGESPNVAFLRARALEGSGKHDEAVKVLEKTLAAEEPPVEAKAAHEALKAGKPWPKDSVNPDGKAPEAAPAKPAEASEKK